jgi:plasmid stabilization system protein ParE
MNYKVRLTLEAKRNIQAISSYIAQDSPESARRWRRHIRERMRTLRNHPEHEIAYHARHVGRDVRHTFYGVYRILFTIEQDTVVVLSVRHGARKPLTLDEVRELGGGGSES